MQITGMLYGARLLDYVEFPASEVLGPDATEDEIQGLIDRHKLIFIKPLFRGGVGKKGKSGLIGKATDLKTALKSGSTSSNIVTAVRSPRRTVSPSKAVFRPNTRFILLSLIQLNSARQR